MDFVQYLCTEISLTRLAFKLRSSGSGVAPKIIPDPDPEKFVAFPVRLRKNLCGTVPNYYLQLHGTVFFYCYLYQCFRSGSVGSVTFWDSRIR